MRVLGRGEPHMVRVGDAVIAWREYGSAEGPPVVLLHSLGLDSDMWGPQLDALADRYRLVVVDTRGHGASDAPRGPYAVADLAADILTVADAAAVGRFHAVGLSLGGQMALWLALHHAGRIRSLVLADTAARIGTPAGWHQRIELVKRDGMAGLRERLLGIWFTPGFVASDPARFAWAGDRLVSTPAHGYTGCCAALAGSDLRDRVAAVAVPTLVLVGEADAATPPAEARWLADHIGDSRLGVLEGAAHIANIEAAEAFSRMLRDFLDEQPV